MSEFRMPSLGADMESATLIQWLVKPGDQVKKGDVILVVETAKGAIEVEVFESGVIDELLVKEHASVPVGTPLARIQPASTQNCAASLEQRKQFAEKTTVVAPAATIAAIKVVPPSAKDRKLASPAARRLAQQKGVLLSDLKGSGPSGAVLFSDVAQIAEPKKLTIRSSGFDPASMRKAIAAAMTKSKREIPHYYLATQIDMLAAQHWLDAYNLDRPPETRLLLSVLLLKAVALSLREFPEMNGFYREEKFEASNDIHPGFAINLRGGGLLTPAIHNVDQLSLAELMEKLQDLTQRTRRGMLRSSEMMDATITITALGERGVEQVFGVIYPPQVAVIGFGKITQRPAVVNDAIGIRPIMDATLAADHRASDGHRGALFLAEIGLKLQHPELL